MDEVLFTEKNDLKEYGTVKCSYIYFHVTVVSNNSTFLQTFLR